MNRQHYFLGITDLVIPETATYDEIHTAINRFIDALPYLAEDLGNNIKREEYTSLTETIEAALPLLSDIHAKILESDAKLIIRRIERTGSPSVLIGSFIANLMTLSIKLQKAQSGEDDIGDMKDAETNIDIANTMTTFLTLLDDGDYYEAHSIISEMMVFDTDTLYIFDKLLTFIVTKDYDEAKALATELKEQHIKVIQQSAGNNFTTNVLAVDDMPESLSFVSNVLKEHYKVYRVTNGKTALKVLRTQKIDLFVLDIDMPEMDGYELAEAIRNTPGYTEVPIIFLTGNSTREHVARAMQIGVNDFIVKPASYEALLTAVNKYI